MKQVIEDEELGKIVYEENFWTGKKSITINDNMLTKISRKEFMMEDDTIVTVNGNYVRGANLVIGEKTISLTSKMKWYEIVLGVIPFLIVLIWGNSSALCQLIPVVGGAIGGAISGLFSCVTILLIKVSNPIWLKMIISLVALVVTFGVCCGIGFAIVSAVK